ncbi:hypothetical protein ACYSJL_10465 [Lactobacillus delbrueckii]
MRLKSIGSHSLMPTYSLTQMQIDSMKLKSIGLHLLMPTCSLTQK